MAVRVRVQNFQSIKDAEILIDGLAVVTGPNNSGKTSLMRAIRGLFTNAPAGPLVRRGEAFLSVELEFDDGTTILWEKGWERPGQKGAAVNRYTVNGVMIQGVGRGVPSEVEMLGVWSIEAGSDKIWPQVAQQFDGTLFLINRPGSVVAEALSDVERVGRLTSALKLSEKDKRTAESDLKVRREDVKTLTQEVGFFDGLDHVDEQVEAVDLTAQGAMNSARHLDEISDLCRRHSESLATLQSLQGFDPHIPSPEQIQEARDLAGRLEEVLSLQERLDKGSESVAELQLFKPVVLDIQGILLAQEVLRTYREFCTRLKDARGLAQKYSVVHLPNLPDKERVQKLARAVAMVSDLRVQWEGATTAVDELRVHGEATLNESKAAAEEVLLLLGDRGICPVCEAVHVPGSHS